ncbi:hypothetical protein ACLMJK_005259 [Lecanora helva]
MPSPGEIYGFLYGQLAQTPPKPIKSFAGRTVIVTGGNSGLGLEAAKQIVHLNVSHLILGCRNVIKGEEAKRSIQSSCRPSKEPLIEVWPIDMAKYDSVLTFGQRARTKLPRLDALILNAGVELYQFELAEGIESSLTINVVSTMLLAQLLLPKLQETADTQRRDTHMTLVGSMIHIFGNSKQLQDAEHGEIFKKMSDPQTDMSGRYPTSKLVLTLAIRDLVARNDKSAKNKSSRVIINDVNPGWCKTNLFRHDDPGFAKQMALRTMVRTGEMGARTLTHAASAGRETHGKYLSECQVKPESKFVRSKAGMQLQERLGVELSELLNRIQPGVAP